MNLKKLQVTVAAHFFLETIDGIYNSSVEVKNSLRRELPDQAAQIEAAEELSLNEREDILISLSDDIYTAELTTELAGEMTIIALYKTIEITIKKMAFYSGLFKSEKIDSFYKVAELKKQFKAKVCNIECLKYYAAFNELRCINNSIKHNGIVGEELAAYSNWDKGQKLTNLYTHYNRLKFDVEYFVTELKNEIIKKMP